MTEQALLQQIQHELHLLTRDRDALRTELQYAHSTIEELSAQNIELNRLCADAQTKLLDRLPDAPKPKPKSTRTSTIPFTPSFFTRTPLTTPTTASTPHTHTRPLTPSRPPTPRTPLTPLLCENYIPNHPPIPLLAPIEALWRAGRPQHALNALHPILAPTVRPAPSPLLRTHALLLRAAILLAWDQAGPALRDADEAAGIARERGWFELGGKAQFYRGLGAVGEGWWGDARWCFGLGVGVRGYEGLVEWWVGVVERKVAEDRKVAELEKGKGKGRMVSEGGSSGGGSWMERWGWA